MNRILSRDQADVSYKVMRVMAVSGGLATGLAFPGVAVSVALDAEVNCTISVRKVEQLNRPRPTATVVDAELYRSYTAFAEAYELEQL